MTGITKIRKEVTTIANRLNKRIKNLSAAFKRAWQIVKGRQLISKIAGVTFGNRQKALRKLKQYDVSKVNVTLEREPDNAYDTNAVRVMVNVDSGSKYHMGFIPKDLAALLAPLLDKGISLAARFNGITGGYKGCENYGAAISIEL